MIEVYYFRDSIHPGQNGRQEKMERSRSHWTYPIHRHENQHHLRANCQLGDSMR
jgi:hypothetical protein